MSSRAIRKAQRQLDEQSHLNLTADESDPEREAANDAVGSNLFALLNEKNEESGEEDEPNEAPDRDGLVQEASLDNAALGVRSSKSLSRKTKKKKKKAAKAKGGDQKSGNNRPEDGISHRPLNSPITSVDDIDSAFGSLNLIPQNISPQNASSHPTNGVDVEQLCALLSIDLPHLNAANEMRRLFGRAALDTTNDDQIDTGAGRRGNRQGRRQGLAGAVAGHNVPGGGGLLGLGLRRNIFIPGKEEWPRGTAGGLGMEVVYKTSRGITEYKFIHNTLYQDVQRQFDTCVQSMDPSRMVQLLQFNPYHISTLLQVSEIAKHERDHAMAGDLLERALFSFGRAVHSTFAKNLSQGKARLDFRRPENREFWAAAWRFIANLGRRGTWRTAYEWAKLLLSIDPAGDHYCIRLIIDQLALRSRQPQQLVDLANSKLFSLSWGEPPNIQVSVALAELQIGQHDSCRRTLFNSIKNTPWLFNRLFQELGINKIPPSVWGSEARTAHEELLSEIYVNGAKDLWKTPEAIALLIEMAGISERTLTPRTVDDSPISLDEARHVILTEEAELIALLPRDITSRISSSADPMPPPDNIPSYVSRASVEVGGSPEADAEERTTIQDFLRRIFPWLNLADGTETPATIHDLDHPEEAMRLAVANSGVDELTILQRAARLQQILSAERARMLEEDEENSDSDSNSQL